MPDSLIHAVTGAFGFSGKYIARRLLAQGQRVITLTNSPDRPNPFDGAVEARPFDFDAPDKLIASLRGTSVLYNTYWVRFNHRSFNHADAVKHTLTLFAAAKAAGVERIVHTSITNPDIHSPLEYFRGKAELEAALVASGISYAIVRPAVLFGDEDILINNIAWTLRKLPFAVVFGDGAYRLQPIHVDDFAALHVQHGADREDVTVDAIGPETFTYRELLLTVAEIIGLKRRVISVPPFFACWTGWLLGALVGDVVITREEIAGLMADSLCVDATPTGTTVLTDWVRARADTLGQHYASELARRHDRRRDYRIS